MHDPFPLPAPQILSTLLRPLFLRLGLSTLDLHIHELLFATLTYTFIYTTLSPFLSRNLFPSIYPHFSARTKLNWDVHIVSLFQSLLICSAALWVMWVDEERGGMGWEERVWGYTGAAGMIQAFAAGYFLWDLGICLRHTRVFGVGLLAHAVAALGVFGLGFRPFVNFYGPTFILYELSSPFLNFHWFFDKLSMTGSKPQWYNGILLLFSFLCCRLLWGTYQSIRVYQDVWAGLHFDAPSRIAKIAAEQLVFEPLGEDDEVMRYAGAYVVPTWLACVYLVSNMVLNTLNFYWFGKMIETVRKRFRDPRGAKKEKEEGVMVEGLVNTERIADVVFEGVEKITTADGDAKGGIGTGSTIQVQRKDVRQRKG